MTDNQPRRSRRRADTPSGAPAASASHSGVPAPAAAHKPPPGVVIPPPTKPRRATKEGREQLLVYLHRDGIKQLKLAHVQEDYPSVSAVVAEAVNEWLKKRGYPPKA